MSELLRAENLSAAYAGGQPVLRGASFCLAHGQRLGVIGDNGSGKTTLFHALMGLIPSQGRIFLEGREVTSPAGFGTLRRAVGLVFQHADDQLFCPTLLEDAAFGPLNLGQSADQAKGTAMAALQRLGLAHLADRTPQTLSGGEKRLAALAGVLAMEPKALLLDEPTEGLDRHARHRLIHVLQEIPAAMLIISHDLDFLAETTSSICLMRDGLLDCTARPAAHTHTHVHAHGHAPHRHEPHAQDHSGNTPHAHENGGHQSEPARTR